MEWLSAKGPAEFYRELRDAVTALDAPAVGRPHAIHEALRARVLDAARRLVQSSDLPRGEAASQTTTLDREAG